MGVDTTGYALVVIASVLSILSCTFIQTIILCHRNLRENTENKQVFILLLFYNLLCISSLLPTIDNNTDLCYAQGILIQLFSLSGIVWTGYIALYRFYDTILNRKPFGYKLAFVIIVSFSLFTALMPLAYERDYSEGTTWCWYGSPSSAEGEQQKRLYSYYYLFFYGIAWLVILWIGSVFIYLIYSFKIRGVEQHRLSSFKYFPIILVVCFIPLTVARIINSSNSSISSSSDEGYKGFFIFAAIIMRLLGFFNAIMYGFNPEVRSVLFRKRSQESSAEIKANEVSFESHT